MNVEQSWRAKLHIAARHISRFTLRLRAAGDCAPHQSWHRSCGRSAGGQFSLFQVDRARPISSSFRIVGHQDDGLGRHSRERLEDAQDLLNVRIEVAGRFIRHDEARIGPKARAWAALLLAPGELARQMTIGQSHRSARFPRDGSWQDFNRVNKSGSSRFRTQSRPGSN